MLRGLEPGIAGSPLLMADLESEVVSEYKVCIFSRIPWQTRCKRPLYSVSQLSKKVLRFSSFITTFFTLRWLIADNSNPYSVALMVKKSNVLLNRFQITK